MHGANSNNGEKYFYTATAELVLVTGVSTAAAVKRKIKYITIQIVPAMMFILISIGEL